MKEWKAASQRERQMRGQMREAEVSITEDLQGHLDRTEWTSEGRGLSEGPAQGEDEKELVTGGRKELSKRHQSSGGQLSEALDVETNRVFH